MKRQTLLMVLCLATVTLAGCTGGGGKAASGPTAISGCVGENCGDINLAEGQGAINGLVIDDRYRPLSEARILLLPLGLDTVSNENGEFGFIGLKPGSYTIKVQKEKHEAAPKRIDVVAGEYAEAIMEARRTVSDDSVILTQEYSIFIPCSIDFIVNGIVSGCGTDLSNDNYRASFTVDYSEILNVTYMVAEMKANQGKGYEVQIRHDDGSDSGGERWAVAQFKGDYVRILLERCDPNGDISICSISEYNGQNNNVPWMNDLPIATILFADHDGREQLQDAGVPLVCCGVGVTIGIRGQFVQSIFVGEPATDITTYAVLQ